MDADEKEYEDKNWIAFVQDRGKREEFFEKVKLFN
jgi:hypothetical protein